MHPKSPQWLDDIADASSFIVESTAGGDVATLMANRMLRQAVERNFEIFEAEAAWQSQNRNNGVIAP